MIVKNLLLIITFWSAISFGGVELKDIQFKMTPDKGFLTIFFNGELKGYPELNVNGKSIQVLIPQSKIKDVLEKSYSFSTSKKDTTIKIYQATKEDAKVKALLPFLIVNKKDQVALIMKENQIELSFPRIKIKEMVVKPVKKASPEKLVKKEFLDEKYLNNLLKVEKTKTVEAKKVVSNDQVNVTQASMIKNEKQAKTSFSLIEYGGKFVAFLALVLLTFYGVISLMRKGFIKKGKLGFLNNADLISVIGQSYIAPKKSLMLIKAHNQVFLVSNTEHGIQPISEIKDAAGLLKSGERSISGTNFDMNLDDAEEDNLLESKVKIKEDITQSNKESSLSDYLNVKDKVKFSDQLKKKVKSLKPLQ